MSQDFSDKEVAATFKALNASHSREESSLIGIYASWAAILLLGACFFFAAVFILDADRRAATARLEQASSLLVQSIESRLLGTTELLQRTSMRLMHVPGMTSRVRSSELAAVGFMHDRREVLELALVDRDLRVLRHWLSPSHNTIANNTIGAGIESDENRKAIESVLMRDASFIGSPYNLEEDGQVYVNIYVPTPVPDQILLARVNFTHMIHEAADVIGSGQYRFYTTKNGVAMSNHMQTNGTPKLMQTTPIPIFNDPTVTLTSESFEHSVFTPDNIKLWVILALAGMLALALGLLLKNQKEQHAAHRRLSAEYSLRVAMAESSLAGVRVTDLEGHILFVNETFQKLVGYSAEELFGATYPYPYWSEDISNRYLDILEKPEIHHVRTLEFQIRRKDGIIFDAQLNVSPLLNEDGTIIGWIGELYDISEQKRARERMNAAHERFTRVVHSMNSAICVISIVQKPHTAPHMLFHNAPYARIFGPDVAGARRLLALIQKSPRITREGVYDDLTERWFDARMQMLTWTDDTEACMIIATDITNQRETELALEEQLRRAETTQRLVTMGEMASSLAHELNQPLAAISNYAVGATCMIEAGKLSREDTLVALGKMSKQAQRAAAIIKRIRSFAATKKTDPQFTAVVPETIVTETMELALIQAAKLKAQIETTIEPDLPNMKGDSVMLEQLLLNLLKNAMEAVQPFPNHTVELNVSKTEGGDFIQFQIRDHGPGISDENKALLYDAFYSTKNEGMGMGLNICRSIVEVHQGRITITDTPGGGATFTFTIPILCEPIQNLL